MCVVSLSKKGLSHKTCNPSMWEVEPGGSGAEMKGSLEYTESYRAARAPRDCLKGSKLHSSNTQ